VTLLRNTRSILAQALLSTPRRLLYVAFPTLAIITQGYEFVDDKERCQSVDNSTCSKLVLKEIPRSIADKNYHSGYNVGT
jgi:hypothetical protein